MKRLMYYPLYAIIKSRIMKLKHQNILKVIILILIIGFISCKQSSTKTIIENYEDDGIHSIVINSEKLHYITKGNGEPVIFIHGTISDYRTWEKQIDTFSTKYKAIAYSRRYAFPNKQIFDETNDYSPKIHSEDLSELINSFEFDKVNLIGHSYGAYTALLTTMKNPNKVKSLVLGEPPALPLLKNSKIGDSLYNDIITKALEPANEAFNKGDESKGVAAFIGGVMGDSTLFYKVPPENRKPWLDNTLELRGSALHQEFTKIDTVELKKLNVPVLLLKGEFSPPALTLIVDILHRYLPNSKVYTMSNSSHGLQSENPGDFNKEVLEFLSNN